MLEALILGIIQGITEFFPVSSSGHLLFAELVNDKLNLGLDFSFQDTNFDILLHLATFIAILIVYRRELREIISNTFQKRELRTLRNLLLISIPALIFGLVLFVMGDEAVKNPVLAASALIVVGVGLIIAEIKVPSAEKTETESPVAVINRLSSRQILVIGVAQSLALVRGVSRSGITFLGGVSQGLTRNQAIDIAFLSSILVFMALIASQILTIVKDAFGTGELSYAASGLQLAVGFLSALVVAIIVLTVFRRIIRAKGILAIFGGYRIVVGILILLLLAGS